MIKRSGKKMIRVKKEIEKEGKGKETGWKKREKVGKNRANFFKKPKRKRNECESIRKYVNMMEKRSRRI